MPKPLMRRGCVYNSILTARSLMSYYVCTSELLMALPQWIGDDLNSEQKYATQNKPMYRLLNFLKAIYILTLTCKYLVTRQWIDNTYFNYRLSF